MPRVVLLGEPLGRLDPGRFGCGDSEVFGPEGGDARPGVGELLPGGGDVSVQFGEPRLGLGGPGGGFQSSESLVALAAGLGQRGPGLLVLVPCGVGGGALDAVLGVGGFGGALSGGAERSPQRGPVVEPAGHAR
jgi:hypothetical protein